MANGKNIQQNKRIIMENVDWLSAYIISTSSGFTGGKNVIPLPTLPTSVSENISLNTNDQAIVARWAPIVTYMNTNSRQVSFNFAVADDYMPDGYTIRTYVNALKSLEYANYSNTSNIISPQCILKLANLTLKGIVTSVSVSWGGPVSKADSGTYTRAEISLQFKEISNVVKGSVEVRNGKGD